MKLGKPQFQQKNIAIASVMAGTGMCNTFKVVFHDCQEGPKVALHEMLRTGSTFVFDSLVFTSVLKLQRHQKRNGYLFCTDDLTIPSSYLKQRTN